MIISLHAQGKCSDEVADHTTRHMIIYDWSCDLCMQVYKPGPRLTLLPHQSISMCEGECLGTRPGTHTSASFLVYTSKTSPFPSMCTNDETSYLSLFVVRYGMRTSCH